MKANNFVKKFGWDVVREILKNAPDWAFETAGINDYASKEWSENYPLAEYCKIDDLKRLVKSHKLVESYGGLEEANHVVCDAHKGSIYDIPKGHEELSLAIQDVESCL